MRACRLPSLGGQATHSDFGWKAADERLLAVVALDPRLLLVELDGLVAEERDKLDDALQQLAGGAARRTANPETQSGVRSAAWLPGPGVSTGFA